MDNFELIGAEAADEVADLELSRRRLLKSGTGLALGAAVFGSSAVSGIVPASAMPKSDRQIRLDAQRKWRNGGEKRSKKVIKNFRKTQGSISAAPRNGRQLMLLQSPSNPGRCRCPAKSKSFQYNYNQAHTVVKAFVLQKWQTCYLCPNPLNRKNEIGIYAIYISNANRKNFVGRIMYVQAFNNPRFCGVRLAPNQIYMLNLSNPAEISSASHWTRGWPVLDACQGHYNWSALPGKHRSFLKYSGDVQ